MGGSRAEVQAAELDSQAAGIHYGHRLTNNSPPELHRPGSLSTYTTVSRSVDSFIHVKAYHNLASLLHLWPSSNPAVLEID